MSGLGGVGRALGGEGTLMRPRWSCEGGNGEKRSFKRIMTRIHWPSVLGWDVFEEGVEEEKPMMLNRYHVSSLLSF